MKNRIFTGAGTALITPMNEQGVDYETFGRLIDWQIEEGIVTECRSSQAQEATTRPTFCS